MNSIQFEDDNGVMWTATIKIGAGPPKHCRVPSKDPTKAHLLIFTSEYASNYKRKNITYRICVGPEKSSISNFSIEELKTLLKESQQSKS